VYLRTAGCDVIDDEPLPGYYRVYTADPFGNRIELMERASRSGRGQRKIPSS
jgi:hypothetical protein